jgi:hypothetical protein
LDCPKGFNIKKKYVEKLHHYYAIAFKLLFSCALAKLESEIRSAVTALISWSFMTVLYIKV